MDKIIKFFKQWDKLAHATVCAALTLWFTMLFSLTFNYWVALLLSTLATAICAFGKEGLDSIQDSNVFSWEDIIADATGWIVAIIPLIVLGL